jgi:hypothetical protein
MREEVQELLHRVHPPRLEGVVKNRGIKPKRKAKKVRWQLAKPLKPQSYTAAQRKDYHLKSRNH